MNNDQTQLADVIKNLHLKILSENVPSEDPLAPAIKDSDFLCHLINKSFIPPYCNNDEALAQANNPSQFLNFMGEKWEKAPEHEYPRGGKISLRATAQIMGRLLDEDMMALYFHELKKLQSDQEETSSQSSNSKEAIYYRTLFGFANGVALDLYKKKEADPENQSLGLQQRLAISLKYFCQLKSSSFEKGSQLSELRETRGTEVNWTQLATNLKLKDLVELSELGPRALAKEKHRVEALLFEGEIEIDIPFKQVSSLPAPPTPAQPPEGSKNLSEDKGLKMPE